MYYLRQKTLQVNNKNTTISLYPYLPFIDHSDSYEPVLLASLRQISYVPQFHCLNQKNDETKRQDGHGIDSAKLESRCAHEIWPKIQTDQTIDAITIRCMQHKLSI